jgi:hypothetical protein
VVKEKICSQGWTMMGPEEKMFPKEKYSRGKEVASGMDSGRGGNVAEEMWFEETMFLGEKVGPGRKVSWRMESGRGGDGAREGI